MHCRQYLDDLVMKLKCLAHHDFVKSNERGLRRWNAAEIWPDDVIKNMRFQSRYGSGQRMNFHRLAGRFVGGDIARWLGDFDEFARAVVGLVLALLLVRFLYRRQIFLRL